MFFTIFDLVLLLILFLFVSFGFWFGLVHTIGALAGVFVGAWVAGAYFQPFAEWLAPFLLGSNASASVIAFGIIFFAVNRLVGFLFYLIDKVFKVVTIIPFLKTINRMAGALFGLVEGVLLVGTLLYVAARYPVSAWFNGVLAGSNLAEFLIAASSVVVPLLPEILRTLQSII